MKIRNAYHWRWSLLQCCRLTLMLSLLTGGGIAHGVTFTNKARIEIADSTGELSWKPSVGALTVSCWFKLSVPTDAELDSNMVILANRTSGSQADPHAYWLQ